MNTARIALCLLATCIVPSTGAAELPKRKSGR